MGTWGALAFDNDSANDWAYDLENVDDLSLVTSALAEVEEIGEGYLDSNEACNALAACEVLARLQGNSGYENAYTEKVDLWVAAHAITPPPELLKRADAVIDRILGKDSELPDLWEEDNAAEWREAVEDLRRRVRK